MSRLKNNVQGLTLIELLIVLALLSVVMLGVFNLFSFVFASWGYVETETEKLQASRLALEILGSDIRNAAPLENELIGVIINNNGSKMELGPPGEKRISYEIEITGGKAFLTRKTHNGTRYVDEPGKILELNYKPGDQPFQLNSKERLVKVSLLIGDSDARGKSKAKEIKAEFTVRNGLTEVKE